MEGTRSIPSELNTIRLDHKIPIYRVHMLVYTLAIIAVIYHRITSIFASSTVVEAGLLWLILVSDLILAFMWACSQAFRWRPVHRQEFLARLPDRASWPALDVFVCTADPHKEPPMGVVNAALSLLAFDYPPEKLSVYISDDGGADVTLFAFMEGAKFAHHWLPFCRENGIKDRSPEAFFASGRRCSGSDEDKLKALKIPKGVVKHMDRMRRAFLWKGNDTRRGINCLGNWEMVCACKENGGTEIIDLEVKNNALLTKWLWHIYHSPNGLWGATLQRLYGITESAQLGTIATSSYFLKDLASLLPFLTTSVTQDAITQRWGWRWSTTSLFTCKSAYKMMSNSGVVSTYHKILWKLKVPTKVQVFIWQMLENKILTQKILMVRSCTVPFGCHLCQNNDMETRDHLFWDCSYTRRFWRGLCAHFNIMLENTHQMRHMWLGLPHLSGRMKRQQRTIWAAEAWAVWKERNRRLFSNKSKPVDILINETAIIIMHWLCTI